MKERMVEVVREIEAVVERTGEAFPLVNMCMESIPWDDYCNPQNPPPLSRVQADWDEMVRILNCYFKECRERQEDFAFVFAACCNLYIKKGMYSQLGMDGFEKAGDWLSGSEEQAEYFKCLWRGISQQEYSYFSKALDIRPESPVPVMYLFVRKASQLCVAISKEQNTDGIAAEVWKYYDMLPEAYQEYVLGGGNFCKKPENENLADDPNLLPYINFKSMKEYLVDYILQYYGQILKVMGLNAGQTNASTVYPEILDRLQILHMQQVLVEAGTGIEGNGQQSIAKFIEMVEKLLPAITSGGMFQESVYFPMRGMFEKLHFLLTESYNEVNESFSAQLAFPGRNATILYRNTYLHLPVILPEKISRKNFLKSREEYLKNQELKQLNHELERQRRRNQEMMDFYIHSWKHISYPQTVKNVAEELRKKDLSLSNRLYKAYNSERTLKGNLQRIQYAFSDRPDEVSYAFREGFYCIGDDSGRRIPELLSESLDLVLFKMLMEDTDSSRRMELCRDSLKARVSLDQLRESYVTAFIDNSGNPEDIFEWFNRNIFNMELSVDQAWQEIPVVENSYGESQLIEIFVELFTNLLTHGADWCRLALESDEQDMYISMTNGAGKGLHGSQKGLKGMENIINKLNMGEVWNAVTGETIEGGAFATKVILRRGLMYNRGRRR